ncbi:MAG TPA: class I SAM-dependent methyltransferase [Patescibacteria group bacterium]|nr:class I SAM-dependent methyltransferase [Patescibacteria group bacterium]
MKKTSFKSTTVKAYDIISKIFKKERTPNFWLDEFKILMGLMEANSLKITGSKFLDLGCGTGNDAHLALDRGMKYVGVDLSKGMLDLARKMVKGAKFLEMDVTNLKFEDNEFDIVWASAVLLHLNSLDLNKALKEIRRVLKPDHFAFISMEKRQEGDRPKSMRRSIKEGKLVKRFFALYTESEFGNILEKAGFNVVETSFKIEPSGQKEWLGFFVRN